MLLNYTIGWEISMRKSNTTIKKIAIIGGGPVGVGMAKALAADMLDFEIIEKESSFGGLWNIASFEARRVYKSAHLISCKSMTQLSDYLMPNNFPVYPNHQLMLHYVRDIANHFGLNQYTMFNTKVENLRVLDNGACELVFNTREKRQYAGVIICNGLLNRALLPNYPGKFSGESIHSIDYLDPQPFVNKRVLVVGSGNSGCDIAVDLCRVCDKVTHSARRAYHFMPKFIDGLPTQEWLIRLASDFLDKNQYWDEVKRNFKITGCDPTDFGLPKPQHPIYACHPIMNSQLLYHIGHGDIFNKPDINRIDKKVVHFVDGTSDIFDAIIYATGFRTDFPFLDSTQFDKEHIFSNTFIRTIDKRFNNVIFAGYFNSPSGLGNLLNFGGRLNSLLFQAMLYNPKVFAKIEKLIQGPEPDLGSGIFIASSRHQYEFDLWKVTGFMTKLIHKLEGAL